MMHGDHHTVSPFSTRKGKARVWPFDMGSAIRDHFCVRSVRTGPTRRTTESCRCYLSGFSELPACENKGRDAVDQRVQAALFKATIHTRYQHMAVKLCSLSATVLTCLRSQHQSNVRGLLGGVRRKVDGKSRPFITRTNARVSS